MGFLCEGPNDCNQFCGRGVDNDIAISNDRCGGYGGDNYNREVTEIELIVKNEFCHWNSIVMMMMMIIMEVYSNKIAMLKDAAANNNNHNSNEIAISKDANAAANNNNQNIF